MEEKEEDTLSPFWHQNGTRLRRSDSLFLNTGALLIFLMVTALALIFIIAPTLHSFTSHIFKPYSVKKSWESLNLVLVLFAILCGFLNKNNTTNETPDEDQAFSETPQEYAKQNTETPRHWYEYSERTQPYCRTYNRLTSFKSYPDLRHEPPWITANDRWRFYDDTEVHSYREVELENAKVGKNIELDTFHVRRKEVPSAPPLPEVLPLSEAPPSPLRLPEEPPSPPPQVPAERRRGGSKNKKASATKELMNSLKGKKKKQRPINVENFVGIETSKHSSQPPTPPPLPPPSIFHSVFSFRKSKHKKRHSHSPPPPPHVSSSKIKQVNVGVPEKTNKSQLREKNYVLEENMISGNESPLNTIPPPPPPPPFNLPAWKFRVQGDFLRIDSISSSSSGSQDLDEVVDSPMNLGSQCNSPSAPHCEESEILLFYPNPNVDTEADTFIERFRSGLKIEKMNSTKEKQGRRRSH